MKKLHKRIAIAVTMTVITILCEHLLQNLDEDDEEERRTIGFHA